jgi:hypothetical protein
LDIYRGLTPLLGGMDNSYISSIYTHTLSSSQ